MEENIMAKDLVEVRIFDENEGLGYDEWEERVKAEEKSKTINYSSLYEAINEFGTEDICKNPGIDPVAFIWGEITDKREEWSDDQILKEAVNQVGWYYSSRSPKFGGIWVQGNQKMDRERLGEWKKVNGRDFVRIDINGEHKSFLKYLPTRLNKFLSVGNEYNLLMSLKQLGYETYKSDQYDDRVKKIDLYTQIDEKKFAIRVFKNSKYAIKMAKEKAERCTAKIVEPIVEFRFDDSRATDNLEHVAMWVKEIKQKYRN